MRKRHLPDDCDHRCAACLECSEKYLRPVCKQTCPHASADPRAYVLAERIAQAFYEARGDLKVEPITPLEFLSMLALAIELALEENHGGYDPEKDPDF